MSTSYYVFAEALIENSWRCLCPFFKSVHDDKFVLSPLYFNGSRSYFDTTYNQLRYLSQSYSKEFALNWLSSPLEEWFRSDVEDFDDAALEEIKRYMLFVPYFALKDFLGDVNLCDHMELVKKNDVALYESGQLDELPYVPFEDMASIPDVAEDLYCIYQWDDPMGWRSHFKELLRLIDNVLSQYRLALDIEAFSQVRFVIFMF